MKFLNLKQKAQSILTFSRWGRKSYSSFLTLQKQVVIAVLSVVYFISTPLLALATVQDTSDVKMEYDLDEIEVSAQRTPAVYSQVARILSVIERKEIESAPAHSVQDLLEYIAGVDVRQRGAEGVQADVSIRGGTFDQSLILLNGINIKDPQTGHHNLNLPVSLAQIERIEVLEGPAARVYGPNAFSGAINIVTKQYAKNAIQLALSAGSFGYANGGLSSTFRTGKISHLLAFNTKRSDGYIANTDFKNLNGFYSNQYNSDKGILKFQLGLSQKGFGANSFYTPKYPNQYEATKTLFTSLKWEGKGKLHVTPSVYYRRNQDRFELFRDNPAAWYKNHNHHLTNVYGVTVNSWFRWAWGKTAFGTEYRSENILSNVLGKDLDKPKPVPNQDAAFTKSDNRNTASLFFEHAAYIGQWTITTGFMANYISDNSNKVNFFPGIDMSYKLSDAVKIYSSYNTSLRMPTFTDLYYKGRTNVGNPNLKPERSATLEGGLKWNSLLFRGHAVAFYRQGKNIIDWVKTESDEIWQPQNLTKLNNFGAEFQFQLLFQQKFGEKYPNLRFNYLYNNLSKEKSNFISNYVLDNLKYKFVASAHQNIARNLSFDLMFVFQDREGTYTKFKDKLPVGEVDYKPFGILDGKLNYKNRSFSAYVSVNNIFNLEYNDIGNVIQPGRWFKVGIAYNLSL